ncbi:hypothetical protein ACUNWD_16380 [Sunxiuqinia sp. A32]|uniref:hypothetical protein n=1 Tax=Sunxiuqinia sp. A32 TaxID=3461496 RepID=UPI004045A544
MKNRNNLYSQAKALLRIPNPEKISMLYHNIFLLKLSNDYLYNTEEEIIELVDFLDSWDAE